MANEVLVKSGAAIILADVTDHSPTAGTSLSGTRTDQLDLTGLTAGAYRQSAKIDFGAARGREWMMRVAIEPASAPAAGGVVSFYVGFSDDATAANSNPGNLSGSDAVWAGYGAAASDATEVVGQLYFVGNLVAGADADVHVADIGLFVPKLRYGMVVVKNGLSVALAADAVEMSVHLVPLVDEIQDAP